MLIADVGLSGQVGKIGIVNACGYDVGAVVVVRLPIDIFLVPI